MAIFTILTTLLAPHGWPHTIHVDKHYNYVSSVQPSKKTGLIGQFSTILKFLKDGGQFSHFWSFWCKNALFGGSDKDLDSI